MIKNMSIILSEHFRLTEFTTSLVAVTRRIDNTPPLSAVGTSSSSASTFWSRCGPTSATPSASTAATARQSSTPPSGA